MHARGIHTSAKAIVGSPPPPGCAAEDSDHVEPRLYLYACMHIYLLTSMHAYICNGNHVEPHGFAPIKLALVRVPEAGLRVMCDV